MYCTACGTLNDDSSNYCKKCGNKLIRFDLSNQNSSSRSVSQELDSGKQNTYYPPQSNLTKTPSSSNSTNSIANSKKGAGVALIIMGLVIALLGGYSASQISNSAKPLTIKGGYTIDGQTVITRSGTIGGDTEAVSFYNGLKNVFIIGGIIFAIGGIALYSKGKDFETLPSKIKHGRIIDLDVPIASVEFDDGSRERLQYRPADIVLVIGDVGKFDIKDGRIVSFSKD